MPLFASFAGHQFLLTSKMKNNIQTVRNQLLFINGGGGGGGERGKGHRRIFWGITWFQGGVEGISRRQQSMKVGLKNTECQSPASNRGGGGRRVI